MKISGKRMVALISLAEMFKPELSDSGQSPASSQHAFHKSVSLPLADVGMLKQHSRAYPARLMLSETERKSRWMV